MTRIRSMAAATKDWLPPKILRVLRRLHASVTGSGSYHAGDSWPTKTGSGWAEHDIVEPRQRLFLAWQEKLKSRAPLVQEWPPTSPETTGLDEHNRYVSAAFVLALAARQRTDAAVLDWGGACADYLLLANKLIPGVTFDWHCVEVPDICRLGREVNPQARYYEDESWMDRRYDLVFSSSAIQYVEDWRALVQKLGAASRDWLFLTRIPVVLSGPSYVFVQNVPQYRTAYPGWAISRAELVDLLTGQDFELYQEFWLGPWMPVYRASKQPVTMGLLFRRKKENQL